MPTQGSRASAAEARDIRTWSPAVRRAATVCSQIVVLPMPASPVSRTAVEGASRAARTAARSGSRPTSGSVPTRLLTSPT